MCAIQNLANNRPIVILGAGISGLTLSILFKNTNQKIILLEKRSPYRLDDGEDPRSFNLTITERGMKSFREIGVEGKVLERVVALQSRVVHSPSSSTSNPKKMIQSYGSSKQDKIFSIKRSDLIQVLYEEAQKNNNVEILFDSEVTEIHKTESSLIYRSRLTGKETLLHYKFLVGADGAYSKVRNFLLTGEIVDLNINYFSWVYKKFVISPADGQRLGMDPSSLHIFPQKEALVVAIPNQDRSFSSIYCTDIRNLPDLKSDQAHQKIETKFIKDYPHLFHLSEHVRGTLKESKISGLVDIHLSKWRYEDRIILIGDAAHAVFPFYGQGMNSALQDCRMLFSLLSSNLSVEEAFAEYEKIQKESTNALSSLCKAHFHYLKEKSFSPLCQAKRQVDHFLGRLKLFSWYSEYSLVAQTELPYNEVASILKKQNLLRKIFGLVLIDYSLAFFIRTGSLLTKFFNFWRRKSCQQSKIASQ